MFEWGFKLLRERHPREDEARLRKQHAGAVRQAERVVRGLPDEGRHVRRKVGELLIHAWDSLPATAARRSAIVTAARHLREALSKEYLLQVPKYADDQAAADYLSEFMTLPSVDNAIAQLARPAPGKGGRSVTWRDFRRNTVGHPEGLPNADAAGIVAAACGVERVGRRSRRP